MYQHERFELLMTTDSVETGSVAYLYEHKQTGARLLWLKNDDANKTFGVGFRTPPTDSTGVAHIVEHSVLSGSRKFKGREPFMELYKSSMQTFLNAMTFSDMTIYPISSKNNQDFLNLMDVYLDAVFFPSIYERSEIFMQEGWHYELFEKDQPMTYKGVVYNEMRGAYGNPERQVQQQLSQTLHPDGTYSYESGGYPYDVPKLTEEAFLDFHRRYYHPSNAFLYLYGDVPAQATFDMIDREYLALFDRTEPDSAVVAGHTPEQPIRAEFTYNAETGAEATDQTYFGYAGILGDSTSVYDLFMQPLVMEVLVNSESSPLKQTLLDKKFGQAILPAGDDSYFLEFGFLVKGADEARFEEFIDVTETTIRTMVEQGIDKNLILAALNQTEMTLRESWGSLKGVIFFIRSIGAYRYDADPMEALNFGETLRRIRSDMENEGFERYLRERILDTPAKVMTIHRPEPGQFKALDDAVVKELAEYKRNLPEEEIDRLIAANEKLLRYQQTEDSKEDKATIPKLDLRDIQREVSPIGQDRQTIGSSDILIHEVASMGIRYLRLAFDLDFVTNEELPYLAYLSEMLGIVDTQTTGYSDLNNQIHQVSSGFHFSPQVYRPLNGSDYRLKMIVSTSALSSQSPRMLQRLAEVLTESTFRDANRLKDVLQQMKSSLEIQFERSGNEVAMTRARSYFSPAAKVSDTLSGIGIYDHLQDLLAHFDERGDELIRTIESLYARLFTSHGMIMSLTMVPSDRDHFVADATQLIQVLPDFVNQATERPFEANRLNEGITSASGVQYVAKAGSFKRLGHAYTGEMVVLKNLLSKDYLHNAIRAQGGAYGAGLRIDPSGEVATFSYRDPNLKKTLEVFNNLGHHLRTLDLDQTDVTAAIIGSVMEFDPALSASEIGSVMLSRAITGLTKAEIDRRLQSALQATPVSLKALAEILDEVMQQNNLCVFGNEATIREQAEVFGLVRGLRLSDK